MQFAAVKGLEQFGRLMLRLAAFCEIGEAVRCMACGQVVATQKKEAGCCKTCWSQLQPLQGGYCPGCGAGYSKITEPPYHCIDCRSQKRPWHDFIFFQNYGGLLRDLITAYKYEALLGYNKLLQGLVLRAFLLHHAHQPVEPDTVVVPVPMHNERLKIRGFNHSLELAKGLYSQGLQIKPDAISRVRPTKPQAGLERKRRWKNLHKAFEVDKQIVRDCCILLVDDVYTTGATVTTCSKALLQAGARRVNVLVLARAQGS